MFVVNASFAEYADRIKDRCSLTMFCLYFPCDGRLPLSQEEEKELNRVIHESIPMVSFHP